MKETKAYPVLYWAEERVQSQPMRLAILSDIHANKEALQAALDAIATQDVHSILCLGDIVGYGPDPEACVELVREHCSITLLGNHDEAVAKKQGVKALPRAGQQAVHLHRAWLSDDQLDWLDSLPLTHAVENAFFVHSSPDAPNAWKRLDTFPLVQAQFSAFEEPICFIGHSHKPTVVSNTPGVTRVRPGHRFLVDVGSIGQPRDRDPRLSYVTFDTEAFQVEMHRRYYDVAKTVAGIHARGLPEGLGSRLERGV